MRKLSLILCCLLAVSVQAQEVSQYVSDMYVQPNGQVKIVERVHLQGVVESKNISRNIPLRFRSGYDNAWRSVSVADVLVRDQDSQAMDFKQQDNGKTYSIDFDLKPEQQMFEILYVVDGLVDSLEGYDQIQYRSLNTDWPGGVDQFAASIHMPQDIPIKQIRCVVGDVVNKTLCNIPPRLDGDNLAYVAHLELDYNDTVSVQVQFGDGVGGKIIAAKLTWWEWLVIVLGVLLIVGVLYLAYQQVTHKKRKHD